jgi:hypothetical protein
MRQGDIVINRLTGQRGRIILIEMHADPHHHDHAVHMCYVEVEDWARRETLYERREWWREPDCEHPVV